MKKKKRSLESYRAKIKMTRKIGGRTFYNWQASNDLRWARGYACETKVHDPKAHVRVIRAPKTTPYKYWIMVNRKRSKS